MTALNPPAPPPAGKYLFSGTLESWDGVLEVVGNQKWKYIGATHAAITGLSPATGPVAGGTPVTITGVGFTGVTSVRFSGVPAKFKFVSDAEITVTSPAATADSVADVVVITSNDGTTAITTADQFTYGTPTPPPPPPPPAPVAEVTTRTASTGTHDNIVAAGSVDLVLQDIKGNPTNYTVYDEFGVVASSAIVAPPEAQVLSAVAGSTPSGTVSLTPTTATEIGDVLVLMFQVGITPSGMSFSGGGVSEWNLVIGGSNSNGATGIAYGVVTDVFEPVGFTSVNENGGATSATLAHVRGLTTRGTLDAATGSYIASTVTSLPVSPITPVSNGTLCFYAAGGWTTAPADSAAGGLVGLPSAASSYVAGYTQGPPPAGAGWTVNAGGNTGWYGVAAAFATSSTVSIPAPNGAWQPGWYYVVFSDASGNFVDSIQVNVFRDLGILPSPVALPPLNTPNPAVGDIDLYLRGWAAFGPERFSISQGVDPTVQGTGSGQTIAQIEAAIALCRGAAEYGTNVDQQRPRPLLVNFPNDVVTPSNQTAYAAGVTQVVTAVGPGTPSNVTHFEGLNEPGSNGLSAAQAAAQFVIFEAAVKAGSPNAVAVGPSDTEHSVEPFLTDVGTSLPGAVSCHLYNAWSGDFVVTDAILAGIRKSMSAHGMDDIGLWCTEAGQIRLGFWNFYMQDPMRQAAWWSQLILTGERYGMPKEHINYYYDQNNGDPYAAWLKSGDGGMSPQVVLTRVYSEEVFGKAYQSALTFGAIGDKFYRGNVYAGANGAVIALTAQGAVSDSVSLTGVSAPVIISDWRGRTSVLSPTAGVVRVPVSTLPTYVRLASAVGVNAVPVSTSDLALSASASCSSGTAGVDVVNNGSFGPGSFYGAPVFNSQKMPEAVTLTWPAAQSIGRVRIRQGAPWSDVGPTGAMVAGKLEYWNGTTYVPCPTVPGSHWDNAGNYLNSTARSLDTNIGHNSSTTPPHCFYSQYDQHWCHNVAFTAPVTTTQLRWTVTQASRGHFPDTVDGLCEDNYVPETLSVSAICAFSS